MPVTGSHIEEIAPILLHAHGKHPADTFPNPVWLEKLLNDFKHFKTKMTTLILKSIDILSILEIKVKIRTY